MKRGSDLPDPHNFRWITSHIFKKVKAEVRGGKRELEWHGPFWRCPKLWLYKYLYARMIAQFPLKTNLEAIHQVVQGDN